MSDWEVGGTERTKAWFGRKDKSSVVSPLLACSGSGKEAALLFPASQLPSALERWSHWVTEKHHSGQPDHRHSTLCSVHTLAFTTRPHCQDDFIISQMTGVDSFYHPRHPGPDALRSSVVCAENSQSCGSVAKIAVYLLFQDLQDTLFYQRVKWKNRAVLHFSSAFLRQER